MTHEAFEIFVIGLGLNTPLQVTQEAEQTLALCKHVYFLHTEPYWTKRYLARFCSDVTDLQSCYEDGEDRINAYDLMVSAVLDGAKSSPPVALALYGSPAVFVNPTQQIRCLAERDGLKVKVLPGISAMECMLVDLGVDPSDGMLVYEANDMLAYRKPLLPGAHCFVWQIGGVESELFSKASSAGHRFRRIKEYLLKFYPPDHLVAIVSCATMPTVATTIDRIRIADLESESLALHQGTTLYIPPLPEQYTPDLEYIERLSSPEHLTSITLSEGASGP